MRDAKQRSVLARTASKHSIEMCEIDGRRMPGRVAAERELTLRLHAEQLPAAIEAQPELAVMPERHEVERRVVAPQRRRRARVQLAARLRHLDGRLRHSAVRAVR